MLSKLRSHLTYANVMVTIGVRRARRRCLRRIDDRAGHIRRNAVRSKHIKEVKTGDLGGSRLRGDRDGGV